jgi:hypothetical protein
MTLFQNLILFTNHYGNLQEMLEMAFFLKNMYLSSEWGRFYVGHPIYFNIILIIFYTPRLLERYFCLSHSDGNYVFLSFPCVLLLLPFLSPLFAYPNNSANT